MKTLGLIGGLSWESTRTYYELINTSVQRRLGGNHSARCIIYSFDFQEIEDLQYKGDWDALRLRLTEAGLALRSAGAEIIAICSNTMHKPTENFESLVGLPLIHIARSVGAEIKASGIRSIGLLGTIFTMKEDFYRGILEREFGLEVLLPPETDMQSINQIIYGELVKGIVRDESRQEYFRVMEGLARRGAKGIVLGCTEIGLLVKDFDLPLFDSTSIHTRAAVELMLAAEPEAGSTQHKKTL